MVQKQWNHLWAFFQLAFFARCKFSMWWLSLTYSVTFFSELKSERSVPPYISRTTVHHFAEELLSWHRFPQGGEGNQERGDLGTRATRVCTIFVFHLQFSLTSCQENSVTQFCPAWNCCWRLEWVLCVSFGCVWVTAIIIIVNQSRKQSSYLRTSLN